MIEDTPTGEVPEPKIEIVEVREVDPIPRDVPDQAVAQRIGDPEDGGELEVYIRQSALAGMTEHVKSNVKQEIGGILVGNYCVDEKSKRFWVDIIGFIPAKHTEAGGAHLRFTLETWADLDDELDARFKDQEHVSVGWYHSHPNLSVFFSPADESVHKHFASWWQVAIVIDPIREEIAFFRESRKTRGRFHRLAGVFVYKDGEQDQPPTLKYDPVDRFGVEDEMPIVSSGGESPAAKSGKGALTINVLERTGLGANKLWIAIITVAALAVGLLAFVLTRKATPRGTGKASKLGVWVDKLYAAEAIEKTARDAWMGNLKVDDGTDEATGRVTVVEKGAQSALDGLITDANSKLTAWDATYERVGAVSEDDRTRAAWETSWNKLDRALPGDGPEKEVDTDLLGKVLTDKFKALSDERKRPRIRIEATNPTIPTNATLVTVAGVIDEIVGRSTLTINGNTAELRNGRFEQIMKLPESDAIFDVVLQANGGAGPAERRIAYTVDRTAPKISIDGSDKQARLTFDPSCVITGHIEEANGLKAFTGPDGKAITPEVRNEFRFGAEFEQEEEREFRFNATDRAGNSSSASIRIRFRKPWRDPLEQAAKAVRAKDFDTAREWLAKVLKFDIPMPEASQVKEIRAEVERWFESPTLVIEAPNEGASISTGEVIVRGSVVTPRPEDRIRVSGVDVELRQGAFSHTYRRLGAETSVTLTMEVYDERGIVRKSDVRHVKFIDPALFKSPDVAGGPFDPGGLASKYPSVPLFVENSFKMRFHLLRVAPAASGAKPIATYLQVTEMSQGESDRGRGLAESATDAASPKTRMALDEVKGFVELLRAAKGNEQPRLAYRLPTSEEWTIASDLASVLAAGRDWLKTAAGMNFADKSAEAGGGTPPTPIPPAAAPAAPALGAGDSQLPPQRAQPPARFPEDDHYAGVAPAVSYVPNRLGFYNLLGNVWEWTTIALTGAGGQLVPGGVGYQLRGGSFRSMQDVHPSFMKDAGNGEAADDAGFRLAFDIDVELVKNLPEAKK